jgi:hypothetical protein
MFGFFKKKRRVVVDEEEDELNKRLKRNKARLKILENEREHLEAEAEILIRRAELDDLKREIYGDDEADLLSGLGVGELELKLFNILSGGKILNTQAGTVEPPPNNHTHQTTEAQQDTPHTLNKGKVAALLSTVPASIIEKARFLEEDDLLNIISEKYPDLTKEEAVFAIKTIKS